MDIVIADTIHRHDQLWGGDDVQMSCPSIMRSPSYFHLHKEILVSVLVWWTNKTGFTQDTLQFCSICRHEVVRRNSRRPSPTRPPGGGGGGAVARVSWFGSTTECVLIYVLATY